MDGRGGQWTGWLTGLSQIKANLLCPQYLECDIEIIFAIIIIGHFGMICRELA